MRSSQPLTIMKSQIMVDSLLLIEKKLGVVSGRSAPSR
jgi:hypothetical protein